MRFIAILLILLSTNVLAQSPSGSHDLFDLNHPFNITISYDFKELDKENEEGTYIPGKISYYLQDSTLMEKSIRIRPRGKSRRDLCQHPPLRIDFSDSLYGVDLFDHWGKMKLVSVCQQAGNYENYLNKEFLIYKAYEKLTEVSFKTYQLNITFTDSGSDKRAYTSPGFFIEDIDDLNKRLNAVEFEELGVSPNVIEPQSYDIMALFQYMIGNTDWYVPNFHNIKLIKEKDTKKILVVPYDFDYAGLVNASYAVPRANIPIESVRDRYFTGICRGAEQYQPVVKLFLEKKTEIYKVFKDAGDLSNYDRKDIIRYLEEFYKILEKNLAGRYIYSDCRH